MTSINPDKLNEVLFFIEDLLDRSQIKFLVLKDLAKQVKASQHGLVPNLDLSCLELGILKRYMTSSGTPMLKGLFNMYHIEPQWNENLIRFEYQGVPVFIRIIHRNYSFFQNPDKAFYRVTQFDVPNPFSDYWGARNLIK